jgi:hypothetical protein
MLITNRRKDRELCPRPGCRADEIIDPPKPISGAEGNHLSVRVQRAFTISFHIIFPAFTIGLAAWLTVLEALYFATGRIVV